MQHEAELCPLFYEGRIAVLTVAFFARFLYRMHIDFFFAQWQMSEFLEKLRLLRFLMSVLICVIVR